MKLIDLSPPLYTGMPVYPGDPEVKITQVHSIKKEGWRLSMLNMSTHVGAHVDSFSHMEEKGKSIDQIPLERFFGKCRLVNVGDNYPKGIGLFFCKGGVKIEDVEKIVKCKPNFVCVGDKCDFPVEVERSLLKKGIVTITNLINTDKLPAKFIFCGFPLNIKNGDGSPIRAVAIIE